MRGKEGGEEWLAEVDGGEVGKKEVPSCDEDEDKSVEEEEGWKCVPEDWKLLDKHYDVAREMDGSQAEFLRELPIILHVKPLHAFMVHGGLVPLDLTRDVEDEGQPLASAPSSNESGKKDTGRRRAEQERGVLEDVPQNREPWNVLNLRSILDDYSLSKCVHFFYLALPVPSF